MLHTATGAQKCIQNAIIWPTDNMDINYVCVTILSAYLRKLEKWSESQNTGKIVDP